MAPGHHYMPVSQHCMPASLVSRASSTHTSSSRFLIFSTLFLSSSRSWGQVCSEDRAPRAFVCCQCAGNE